MIHRRWPRDLVRAVSAIPNVASVDLSIDGADHYRVLMRTRDGRMVAVRAACTPGGQNALRFTVAKAKRALRDYAERGSS
jgi:hypothetical protein